MSSVRFWRRRCTFWVHLTSPLSYPVIRSQQGTCFNVKLYPADAYMCIWLNPKDIHFLTFVVPPHPVEHEPFVTLHLLLHMGCVDIPSYFLYARNRVADLANGI